ncbi:OmpA-like protein [Methyloglobulus morosus KoM1]|uniref:OmpA-like protein n=1 Tax=Methyloglobulus morosus KoM1 TaxID=1116472 RepID=V5C1K7_9GAMM|nr:OmpA-like protein [Methyloglobulus morosus]ESS70663.1 OmpA-like protein [Methyloglobulus morosus KoM1]
MKTVWGIRFLTLDFDWKPVVTAFLCSLLIVGCASLGGTYSEDKGDICADSRGDLRRTEDYFAKQSVTNILGGAAAGAVSGAIISAISGGDIGKGAAIGAAAGAGVGLLKTLYDSLDRENKQIDLATNAFNSLSQCRFKAADQVRSDFKVGRITEQDALKKLSDLKMRFNEDIVIAERIGAKMSERSTEFQSKLVKEDPSVAPYLAAVQSEQANTDNLKGASQSSAASETETKIATSGKKGKKYKQSSKSTVTQLQNASASKETAKAQISDKSKSVIGPTETNIVKANQYNSMTNTAKHTALNNNFNLKPQGDLGLLLFPYTGGSYLVSGLEGQGKQCSVLF